MGTLTSPALSRPATPLDERYRIRRVSQQNSVSQQHSPVGIPRDGSIMSASRIIIPATPTVSEASMSPYMYSQGHLFGAPMTCLQTNLSPISENTVPGQASDTQDSSSPSNSSSPSTSVSTQEDLVYIEPEAIGRKQCEHDDCQDEIKSWNVENNKDVVITTVVDDTLQQAKNVIKAECQPDQHIEILPGSAAKDDGERLAFRSFTEPDNNSWTAVEPRLVEVDTFDYVSAYYGREASIGNGANVFEHIADESESEPSEYCYDDDQMTDVEDYEVSEDEDAADEKMDWTTHLAYNYMIGPDLADELAESTLNDTSVMSNSGGKDEKSALGSPVTAPASAHTNDGADITTCEPQPEQLGQDAIVLFDGSKVPMGCTCGTGSGETPTTASSSETFPFSRYPQIDYHDEGCPASFAGGYHCLPMILLQKAIDAELQFSHSLPSTEFVDGMLCPKSRGDGEGDDEGEEERNTSRPPSAASRATSRHSRSSLRTARMFIEGIEFADPVQLSLEMPRQPEAVFLYPSWHSSLPIPLARPRAPRVPGRRPRLTIRPPGSPKESRGYDDEEIPLWWRYLIFPLVSIFSSRVTRDTPYVFWLRQNPKVETPLAEATTSPERRLEAELRRQKLLWNVMGILLTGVLLGGVVAGVAIYYFGRGGDPGILTAKHTAAAATQ
ncbi:hypothetical protein V1525DRAFT_394904 [Lipomyces kononenkoae]|uniref:Uncharacterized protein n=1 Tax=Lipomyces kononenkoae TaxID=34357 RepID=A0ACC3TA13_LIPKO